MAGGAPCPLFVALSARIDALRDTFVRDQIVAETADPAGFTPDPDRLAAFRLLTHAEFEDFLEAKAREGLDTLELAFNGGTISIRANVSLLVIGALLTKPPRFESPHWEAFATEVIAGARNVIKDNDGITKFSFSKLAVFSGKMPDEIDVALTAALTAYGKKRGDVAHKSVARVATIRAPSAESKDADDLLKSLQGYFY